MHCLCENSISFATPSRNFPPFCVKITEYATCVAILLIVHVTRHHGDVLPVHIKIYDCTSHVNMSADGVPSYKREGILCIANNDMYRSDSMYRMRDVRLLVFHFVSVRQLADLRLNLEYSIFFVPVF